MSLNVVDGLKEKLQSAVSTRNLDKIRQYLGALENLGLAPDIVVHSDIAKTVTQVRKDLSK